MPIRRARCGRCQAKSADNTGCCKGERRQWRKQRTEAGAAVAECEGLLPPKHDAGTATRHYRAFWQRRCRAAAAEAVLKPLGGNCAVLPKIYARPGRRRRRPYNKFVGSLYILNEKSDWAPAGSGDPALPRVYRFVTRFKTICRERS